MKITNEQEYKEALEQVEQQIGKVKKGSPEAKSYEILLDEISRYEDAHYIVSEPSPEALSKFKKDQESDPAPFKKSA
jgi:antitoxin component HigA of HigAB toxin-antitoxin module